MGGNYRGRRIIGCATAAAIGAATLIGPAAAEVFSIGGFSFSDEMGGFRIVAVSGSGSKLDPAVVEEEIFDVAPVTLVIRRIGPPSDDAVFGRSLVLTKIVRNATNRIWGGFELELQEILNEPSVYGDGLSFNQMDVRKPDVSSDAFNENNRLFEPHDRIRFQTGHVDPQERARFSMVITDPTPVPTFFLVQDPQILFAGAPEADAVATAALGSGD